MLTVSDALYQEQKKVCGNPDGTFRPVTYEDTKAMPIMDSVIRETLRMVSDKGFWGRVELTSSTPPSSRSLES